MFCKYCGHELQEGSRFCGNCGCRIDFWDAVDPGSGKDTGNAYEKDSESVNYKVGGNNGKPSKKKPSKHKKPVILFVILAVVLIAAVSFLVVTVIFLETDESEVIYARDESLIISDAGNLSIIDVSDYGYTAAGKTEAREVLEQLSDSGVLSITDASDELTLQRETTFGGTTYYRFQQEYNGYMVYGKSVMLTTDEDGNVGVVADNLADMTNAEMTPGIPSMEAASVATAYLESVALENGEEDYESVSPTDTLTELCYYVLSESGDNAAILAYAVTVVNGVVFVDACTGEVIGDTSFVNTLTGYNSDGSIEVPVYQIGGTGDYYLRDEERSIYVGTWNGQDSNRSSSVYSWVRSENLYFGDTEEEQELEYDEAIGWLLLVQQIYDFYYDNFGEVGKGITFLLYNDGRDFGLNAYGGLYAGDYNYLSIGTAWDLEAYDCLDVMGHEFTHAITKSVISSVFGSGSEAKAVSEGISDIMGNLIEASAKDSEPDWDINLVYGSVVAETAGSLLVDDRYAYNPVISNYSDFNSSMDSHDSGTLLFYTAYIMWKAESDILGIEPIDDVDTMAELWYRTILLLNADATFADCRSACELAALEMLEEGILTRGQQAAVVWAFDQAGIPSDSSFVDYYLANYESYAADTDEGGSDGGDEGTLEGSVSAADAYELYLEVSDNRFSAGSWAEEYDLDVDVEITYQSENESGSFYLNIVSYVSGYDGGDSPNLEITGTADGYMGSDLEYTYYYEDGYLIFDYTEPYTTKASTVFDDTSILYDGTLLEEYMLEDAVVSDGMLQFTVPSEYVDLISGTTMDGFEYYSSLYENLAYSDIVVTVTYEDEMLTGIYMTFEASAGFTEESGAEGAYCEMEYDLSYVFSDYETEKFSP